MQHFIRPKMHLVNSPKTCQILKGFGVYCITLFFLSLTSNLLVIWCFFNSRRLCTPINSVTLALIIICMIGTLTELPMVTLNAFNCK